MLFRRQKKEREALAALQVMTKTSWRCKSCSREHTGLMDLAMSSPCVQNVEETIEDNSALRMDGNFLSEDFCVVDGKNFIIRCVLEIPITGLENPFGFGIWSSLSKENFQKYLEEFDEGISSEPQTWSSWFCSELSYFGNTFGQKAWVLPRRNRRRPLVKIMDKKSILGQCQSNGIAATELIKILEYYGNHLPEDV